MREKNRGGIVSVTIRKPQLWGTGNGKTVVGNAHPDVIQSTLAALTDNPVRLVVEFDVEIRIICGSDQIEG